MLTQGLILMVAGMGTVLLFLVVMVLVMQAVGVYFKRHAERFAPAPVVAARTARPATDEQETLAAVLAAVTAHRRR